MKNLNKKEQYSLTDFYIIFVLLIFILVLRSLKTLLEIFTYGFFKKEILTNKSDLGFDLKIKLK